MKCNDTTVSCASTYRGKGKRVQINAYCLKLRETREFVTFTQPQATSLRGVAYRYNLSAVKNDMRIPIIYLVGSIK